MRGGEEDDSLAQGLDVKERLQERVHVARVAVVNEPNRQRPYRLGWPELDLLVPTRVAMKLLERLDDELSREQNKGRRQKKPVQNQPQG